MDRIGLNVLCRQCFTVVNTGLRHGRSSGFGLCLNRNLYSTVSRRRNPFGTELCKESAFSPRGWRSLLGWRLSQLQQYSRGSGRWYSKAGAELPKSPPGEQRGPVSWKGLLVIVGLGGAMLLGLRYVRKEKELMIAKERSKSLGKARLGGDWELVNASSQKVTNRDFFGKWIMIYFGFTHCPDICPDEMEKMVIAADNIESMNGIPNLHTVFITVDPDRDTPAAVGEYVKEFSPKMIGLTGTVEQINTASRAYRVYYSMGPKDEDNDYIVDHTIIMYLINPNGEFVDYYGQNKTAEEIATSVALHMKKYAAMH